MPTCRECTHSKEFAHFKKNAHPWTQQNVFCHTHASIEPVFGYADTGRFGKIDAPTHCFKAKEHSRPKGQ